MHYGKHIALTGYTAPDLFTFTVNGCGAVQRGQEKNTIKKEITCKKNWRVRLCEAMEGEL
jgi:hypothetical protein